MSLFKLKILIVCYEFCGELTGVSHYWEVWPKWYSHEYLKYTKIVRIFEGIFGILEDHSFSQISPNILEIFEGTFGMFSEWLYEHHFLTLLICFASRNNPNLVNIPKPLVAFKYPQNIQEIFKRHSEYSGPIALTSP